MTIKKLIGGFMTKKRRRHTVNEISGCEKGIAPKLNWDFGLKRKCSSSFKEVFVLAFDNTILLRCTNARCLMKDAKRGIKSSSRIV